MKKYSLMISVLLLLFGCGVTNDQEIVVKRAMGQIEKCKNLGEVPFAIKGKYLVWDLSTKSLHPANNLLPSEMRYHSGGGNITVFLVTAKQNQLVGKYTISGEPGYRQWVDVYVIQAPEMKAIGAHQLVSLDPRQSRPVQHTPEYGDPTPPLVDWIRTLPMEVVQMKRDPDRTEQACTAAANKWNEEGIALLISRLHERDDLVRKSAAEALGKRGDKRAIEPLRTLLLQMRKGGADFMTDIPLPAPLPGKRFLMEDYAEHIVGYKAVVKAISEIERKNNLTHVEVAASSKSKAEYRGISRCERTQVEVTFDYDPIQQIIKNFAAFHSCIGSPPGISWTINQDVAVQPNGQFSYEDKYGNFAKGTISKNSKASGELGSYSAVDVLTCKDGNQYRLCSQWRAAPAFPQ